MTTNAQKFLFKTKQRFYKSFMYRMFIGSLCYAILFNIIATINHLTFVSNISILTHLGFYSYFIFPLIMYILYYWTRQRIDYWRFYYNYPLTYFMGMLLCVQIFAWYQLLTVVEKTEELTDIISDITIFNCNFRVYNIYSFNERYNELVSYAKQAYPQFSNDDLSAIYDSFVLHNQPGSMHIWLNYIPNFCYIYNDYKYATPLPVYWPISELWHRFSMQCDLMDESIIYWLHHNRPTVMASQVIIVGIILFILEGLEKK